MSEVLAQLEKKGGGGKITQVANFTNNYNAQGSTYTFSQAIKKGLVFLSAANNSSNPSLYETAIRNLTSGSYTLKSTNSNVSTNTGVATAVYEINNVPQNAVMTYITRFYGIVQILKID